MDLWNECEEADKITRNGWTHFFQAQQIIGSVLGIVCLSHYILRRRRYPRIPEGAVKVSKAGGDHLEEFDERLVFSASVPCSFRAVFWDGKRRVRYGQVNQVRR